MDPSPFLRLTIHSLALKLPSPTKPTPLSGIHPETTPCFCTIHPNSLPSKTALLPLSYNSTTPETTTSAPAFHLDSASLRRLSAKPLPITISVYNGRMAHTCGLISAAKLVGRVVLTVDLSSALSGPITFHTGWLKLSKNRHGGAESKAWARLHVVVRCEPDPRFVFEFGGEPECSPVVFQIQGNMRQPVFSCKFSCDRNYRSRSLPSDFNSNNPRTWRRSLTGDRERHSKDRKGWMVTIHDLSGSPVAAASMITPFVPSPGSDRVSRSNPGAWLILRPNGASVSGWKPWARLEAWRERGPVDGLGYKVELFSANGPANGVPIAEGTMSVKKGGQFCIDYKVMKDSGLGSRLPGDGFVMSSSVDGEGKVSKPVVQVGAHHVKCMPDAALFIALSAAIDLSMDACSLFSHKLRKELCHHAQDSSFL
ncbi:hypothetical protein PIB30_009075 [Stylosanthes scabra]|uniref:Formin-like protein 18 n=1 Tax=Stylosanthes scabra TaxID=79078 RepID=A0ABU6V7I8_9FABA|nr:hypothetical protein [Stylosanthes scabra]